MTILTLVPMLLTVMLAIIPEASSICMMVNRVQKVRVKQCSIQNLNLPICFGACPSSEYPEIEGVNIVSQDHKAVTGCTCCKPTNFKTESKVVMCYRRLKKNITLKIPTACMCTACNNKGKAGKTKMKVDRTDYMENSKGVPESRRALYNFLWKV